MRVFSIILSLCCLLSPQVAKAGIEFIETHPNFPTFKSLPISFEAIAAWKGKSFEIKDVKAESEQPEGHDNCVPRAGAMGLLFSGYRMGDDSKAHLFEILEEWYVKTSQTIKLDCPAQIPVNGATGKDHIKVLEYLNKNSSANIEYSIVPLFNTVYPTKEKKGYIDPSPMLKALDQKIPLQIGIGLSSDEMFSYETGKKLDYGYDWFVAHEMLLVGYEIGNNLEDSFVIVQDSDDKTKIRLSYFVKHAGTPHPSNERLKELPEGLKKFPLDKSVKDEKGRFIFYNYRYAIRYLPQKEEEKRNIPSPKLEIPTDEMPTDEMPNDDVPMEEPPPLQLYETTY